MIFPANVSFCVCIDFFWSKLSLCGGFTCSIYVFVVVSRAVFTCLWWFHVQYLRVCGGFTCSIYVFVVVSPAVFTWLWSWLCTPSLVTGTYGTKGTSYHIWQAFESLMGRRHHTVVFLLLLVLLVLLPILPIFPTSLKSLSYFGRLFRFLFCPSRYVKNR